MLQLQLRFHGILVVLIFQCCSCTNSFCAVLCSIFGNVAVAVTFVLLNLRYVGVLQIQLVILPPYCLHYSQMFKLTTPNIAKRTAKKNLRSEVSKHVARIHSKQLPYIHKTCEKEMNEIRDPAIS